MTDAERQRRHRAQFRDSKPVTKSVAKPDVTRLQAENAALAKELTRAKQALQRRKRRKRGTTYWLEYGERNTPRRVSREFFEAATAQFQEEREAELKAEIAALKDENAKLRGEIAKLQERQTPKPRKP